MRNGKGYRRGISRYQFHCEKTAEEHLRPVLLTKCAYPVKLNFKISSILTFLFTICQKPFFNAFTMTTEHHDSSHLYIAFLNPAMEELKVLSVFNQ